MARSPALLGFGGDSAVELLSASVVFWRFNSRSDAIQATSALYANLAKPLSARCYAKLLIPRLGRCSVG